MFNLINLYHTSYANLPSTSQNKPLPGPCTYPQPNKTNPLRKKNKPQSNNSHLCHVRSLGPSADQNVADPAGEVNEYELNTLVESGSRLSFVSWVPDHGTYTSERYLDTGLISELPLCLTRRASVTLKPLFQHRTMKKGKITTVEKPPG